MAQIGFETPGSPDDILGMLNKAGHWQFTLSLPDGTTYGHLPCEHPAVSGNAIPGQYVLISGEAPEDAKPIFVIDEALTMLAFLEGMFLGTFKGRSLEDIQEELMRRGELFGEQDV